MYARSLSADHETPGPTSSPYILPSNREFGPRTSTTATTSDPILVASDASFDSRLLATTQEYTVFSQPWNAPLYSPSPPVNMSSWDFSPWTPSLSFTSHINSRSEMLQYSTPSGPPVFAQPHLPSQQTRDLLSSTDHYVLGSSYGLQSQAPGVPNVSLPISSPYHQGLYPGSH